MKVGCVRRKKYISLLVAVAYHIPTSLKVKPIHSFHLQPVTVPTRIRQGTGTTTTTNGVSKQSIRKLNRMILRTTPPLFNDVNDNDDSSDEEQRLRRELGRGSRRRIRTLQRDDEDVGDTRCDDRKIPIDDDDEFDVWRQTTTGSDRTASNKNERYTTTTTEEYLDDDDDDDDFEDYDNDDVFDIDESEQYDLLENIIIPNPLLDSMDPDGTIERLPELLSDPRFWFDMVLFVLFLDFLSFAGPQSDPFIGFPWFY